MTPNSLMRTFIAVDIPERIRVELGKWQKDLSKFSHEAVLVHPENIHLTLAFLGEIPSSKIERVFRNLSAFPPIDPFTIQLKGFGLFPHARRPRVLWVRIKPCPPLEDLSVKLNASLKAIGVPLPQRAFKPHLTLARFRVSRLRPEIKNYFSADSLTALDPIIVQGFSFFESILKPEGPTYHKLAHFPAN